MNENDSGLNRYLREIGRIPLLTPGEEIELAGKIKEGNTEARERMIPCHSPDQVSADRQRGQQRPQRWQGGEKKACGALGFLPDREEPRHDGPGTVTPLPGRVNAAHEPFTRRLHREYERSASR